ncbi:hypothetical protein HDU67_005194 [Dinochytrium kinnereticum]|nr:hypothetical protein HDU67_005194 [Dinochytrium kinnereticum]
MSVGASIKALRVPTSFAENEAVIKDYKEGLKKEAQRIVTVEFPTKIKVVQQILKNLDTLLQDVKSLVIHSPSSASFSQPSDTANSSADGNFNLKHRIDPTATPRKRKKLSIGNMLPEPSIDDDEEDAAEALAATPVPHPHIPKPKSAMKAAKEESQEPSSNVKFLDRAEVNAKIRDMMRVLRVELREIVNLSSSIRGWVQAHLHKQDGFDEDEESSSSLHIRLIKEFTNAESGSLDTLESHHKYHMARAELIAKCLEYPNVADFTEAVHVLDELQATHVRVGVQDCLQTYALLYDLMTKHMDDITAMPALKRRASSYMQTSLALS